MSDTRSYPGTEPLRRDDTGAYRMLNCPFCDSEIMHVESWAKSFNPPRLYHEWHHPRAKCRFSDSIIEMSDEQPANQAEAIKRWNTRAPRPLASAQQAVKPSDEQIGEAILKFARSRGPSINLIYDSGSYEITKPTGAAMNLARDILALSSTQRSGMDRIERGMEEHQHAIVDPHDHSPPCGEQDDCPYPDCLVNGRCASLPATGGK
jgi:hypothetical protein